jgi:hypothetical protein
MLLKDYAETNLCDSGRLGKLNKQVLAEVRKKYPLEDCASLAEIDYLNRTLPYLQPKARAALAKAVAEKDRKIGLNHAYRNSTSSATGSSTTAAGSAPPRSRGAVTTKPGWPSTSSSPTSGARSWRSTVGSGSATATDGTSTSRPRTSPRPTRSRKRSALSRRCGISTTPTTRSGRMACSALRRRSGS